MPVVESGQRTGELLGIQVGLQLVVLDADDERRRVRRHRQRHLLVADADRDRAADGRLGDRLHRVGQAIGVDGRLHDRHRHLDRLVADEVGPADRIGGIRPGDDAAGLGLARLGLALGEGDLRLDDVAVDGLADRADRALELGVIDIERRVGLVIAEEQPDHVGRLPAALTAGVADGAVEIEGESGRLGLDAELGLAVGQHDLAVDVGRQRLVDGLACRRRRLAADVDAADRGVGRHPGAGQEVAADVEDAQHQDESEEDAPAPVCGSAVVIVHVDGSWLQVRAVAAGVVGFGRPLERRRQGLRRAADRPRRRGTRKRARPRGVRRRRPAAAHRPVRRRGRRRARSPRRFDHETGLDDAIALVDQFGLGRLTSAGSAPRRAQPARRPPVGSAGASSGVRCSSGLSVMCCSRRRSSPMQAGARSCRSASGSRAVDRRCRRGPPLR